MAKDVNRVCSNCRSYDAFLDVCLKGEKILKEDKTVRYGCEWWEAEKRT